MVFFSLFPNAWELRLDFFSVEPQIPPSFTVCEQNFTKLHCLGVVMRDLKCDKSVTEKLGGVRNNNALKKTSLLGLGLSKMSEIWTISPLHNLLFDKTRKCAYV